MIYKEHILETIPIRKTMYKEHIILQWLLILHGEKNNRLKMRLSDDELETINIIEIGFMKPWITVNYEYTLTEDGFKSKEESERLMSLQNYNKAKKYYRENRINNLIE